MRIQESIPSVAHTSWASSACVSVRYDRTHPQREAKFIDSKDGPVRLQKKDGTQVSVPLEKLGAEDQAFVKARANEKRVKP